MNKILSFILMLTISTTSFAQTEVAQLQPEVVIEKSDPTKPEGLKVGDEAPQITGIDQNGTKVNLQEILKTKEVVLVFYRGQWCPYCNRELSKINEELKAINAKGATVIAITPETAENIQKTIEKTKTSFGIVEDKGLAIMKSYKVSFGVDDETISKYKKYGIDFEKANGANVANLPVPATYIIGKDGKIKYVFFNPDYSKRASVEEIIKNL